MEKSSTHEGLSEMAMEILSRKKPKVSKNGKSEHKNGKSISKNGNGAGKHSSDIHEEKSAFSAPGILKSPMYEDPEVLDNAKLLSILMEVKNGNFNVKMP